MGFSKGVKWRRKINMNFIKIPKRYVWIYNGNIDTLVVKYKNYRILYILSYISFKKNMLGYSEFTIEEIIRSIGIKSKRIKKEVINTMINDLELLKENGFIKFFDGCDIYGNIKHTLQCDVNHKYETKDGKDINFMKLTNESFIRFCNIDTTVNKYKLFSVYCYILARTICYDYSDDMSIELEINKKTFLEYIKILRQNGMICYGNIGVVINAKGNCEQARNVYAIDQESFKNALTSSEKWYLDRGYVVCNKNY